MKSKIPVALVLCMLPALTLKGGQPLSIGPMNGTWPPCLEGFVNQEGPTSEAGLFLMPGLVGQGVVNSSWSAGLVPVPNMLNTLMTTYVYYYSVDLTAMSGPPGNCMQLSVPGYNEVNCDFDGNGTLDQIFVESQTPGVSLAFAMQNLLDVSFLFGPTVNPCLAPGAKTVTFGFLSPFPPTLGVVYVTDVSQPAVGPPTQETVTAPAIVPDCQLKAFPTSLTPFLQAFLTQGGAGAPPPTNGLYSLRFQLYDSPTNGNAMTPPVTNTAQVMNGLLTTPLNFSANSFWGQPRWLDIGLTPGTNGPFTALTTRLPLTPAPQALYAYTAGSVAALGPGQAVTSLNGLSDAVQLQAGANISVATNGNTLVLSAAIVSDRNLKTGFLAVDSDDLLTRVSELPVQTWRFKRERPEVRHLGPTAQDFRAAFGLGDDDLTIGIGDEGGVALAAIQALNKKLESELKARDAQIQQMQEQLRSLKDCNHSDPFGSAPLR